MSAKTQGPWEAAASWEQLLTSRTPRVRPSKDSQPSYDVKGYDMLSIRLETNVIKTYNP